MTRFSVKPASETPQPEDTEAGAAAPISPEIDVTLEMVEPSPILAPEEPVILRKPKSSLAERSIASCTDQKEVRFDESKLGQPETPKKGRDSSPTDRTNLLDLENGEDEENGLYLFKSEAKTKPKMSTFLQSLGTYDTTLQMKKTSDGANLSTLMGVYFPCLQNILGVILFIRMPWIVGMAGVVQSLCIIGTCSLVTFLTAISTSAIATNGVVPAGGSYFMISRALGPQFGGSVGIIFFLGTSFAASMYITGAIEILLNYLVPAMNIFPNKWNNMRLFGACMLVLMVGIVGVGVRIVNKLATVFLACVILSILAIWVGILGSLGSQEVCMMTQATTNGTAHFLASYSGVNCTDNGGVLTGGLTKLTDGENFMDNLGPYYMKTGEVAPGVAVEDKEFDVYSDLTTSFTILLAIFFPSCTGIMAGSNRSGDLANAQTSIPKGTLGAQVTTTIIYLVTAVLCGAAATREVLIDKYGDSINGGLIMSLIAFPHPYVVLIGCLLSTIGAGLQSLVGAPRLLYAIASDDVIPAIKFFGVISGNGEPLRALFCTFCIASIGIAIGNVDYIAPIITMFFLVCYACVNLACTLQSVLRAPNWRPRFTLYHWSTSLLGLILCLTLMFISNWMYAFVALAIAGAIYKYIDYKGAEKEWGDGIRGLELQAARYSLLAADHQSCHVKNWRPQLLVLLSYKENLTADNIGLLSFVRCLKHGNGLVIVGTVVPYDLIELIDDDNVLEKQKRLLKEGLKTHKLEGFIQVTCEESVPKGTTTLLQTAGLGGLKPNTILMGWPEHWKTKNSYENFSRVVRCANVLNQSVLVARGAFPKRKEKLAGSIDLWWVVHDGGMMLLLAHLIRQHKTWSRCRLRIFTVAQLEDDSVKMKSDLKKILYELRIDATVQVIEMSNQDISAYTYERTVGMAERNKIMEKMGLTKRQQKRTLSFVVDSAHTPGTSGTDAIDRETDNNNHHGQSSYHPAEGALSGALSDPGVLPAVSVATEDLSHGGSLAGVPEEDPLPESVMDEEEKITVRRSQLPTDQLLAMDTSVKLNRLVKEYSDTASMVMLNMPPPPQYKDAMTDQNYVEYLDVLTEGLPRVLLVRGSGTEVVTVYS